MSKNSSTNAERVWTIDVVRGVLMLALLLANILLALSDPFTLPLRVLLLDWHSALQALGVGIFLVTIGIALSLGYRRMGRAFARTALLEGIGLLFIGFFVTIATFINDPRTLIAFGIISLIGAAIMVSLVVVARPLLSLITGIILLVEGALLSLSPKLPSSLGWIGPSPFLQTSIDYYPIIPWTALVLIGIYLGYRLYPRPEIVMRPRHALRPLTWLGKNALVIYLIHQPLIVGSLLVLKLA
ncbi:MAG: heparan-alpha-glucosaminide N-acetyltransferase domain-containing protein [Nanoarchaeota archaeon]